MPSVYWIFLNKVPWFFDSAAYATETFHLGDMLFEEHSFDKWFSVWLNLMNGYKSPGISLIGQFFVPFARLSTCPDFVIQLSVIFTHAIALWFLYDAVLRINGMSQSASIAVLFVASTPIFIGLSHYYFVEPLQTLSVAYFWWLAARVINGDLKDLLSHVTFAGALGMLAKITTPIYIVVPCCLILNSLIRNKTNIDPKKCIENKVFFALSVLTFVLMLFWYAKNITTILDFAQWASQSEYAINWGSSGNFFEKLQHWFFRLNLMIFPGLIKYLVIFSLFYFFAKAPKSKRFNIDLVFLISGLVSFIFVIFLFVRNINEEVRYLEPLVVPIGIVLGVCSAHLTKLLNLLFAIIFICYWGINNLYTFTSKISQSLIVPTWYLDVYDGDKRADNELRSLVSLLKGNINGVQTAGVVHPIINAPTLNYYITKYGPRWDEKPFFMSLEVLKFNPVFEDTKKILQDHDGTYFVTLSEKHLKNPANQYDLQVNKWADQFPIQTLSLIKADKNWVQINFKSDFGIEIYKKTLETSFEDKKIVKNFSGFPIDQITR